MGPANGWSQKPNIDASIGKTDGVPLSRAMTSAKNRSAELPGGAGVFAAYHAN
jgi:hypothetical protein